MSHLTETIKSLLDQFTTKKAAIESGLMLNVNIDGNRKLKNTDLVRFMIWNLPARITCPYRTPLCEKFCYAGKAETAYPDALPFRMRNFEASRNHDFAIRMIFTIEVFLRGRACKGKKVVFRIHESGDFYNQEYTSAWLEVARYFEGDDRIVFMAYTKSFRYFKGNDIPKNMVVRASVWADTDKNQLSLIQEMDLPVYTAFDEDTVNDLVAKGIAVRCNCEDCANCGLCWNGLIKYIVCVIH